MNKHWLVLTDADWEAFGSEELAVKHHCYNIECGFTSYLIQGSTKDANRSELDSFLVDDPMFLGETPVERIMVEAKNDLLFYFSKDGGLNGFYISIASTKLEGKLRAEQLADKLRPFLAEGVTVRTEVRPSRFAPELVKSEECP